MSQGILLFAHDNEQVQYGVLAVWAAKRLQRYLNRPVSLVTDQQTLDNLLFQGINANAVFDTIITHDVATDQVKRYGDRLLTFKNIDRLCAYDVTPYEETIVLDTDIVVQSDRLNQLWNSNHDLMVCRDAVDVYGTDHAEFTWLSKASVRFFWATLFYFRKSSSAQLFFEKAQWVRDQYAWLANVHGVRPLPLRNDYVWSIALHELGGLAHADWCATIPWNLIYAVDSSQVQSINSGVRLLDHGQGEAVIQPGTDIHVMDKLGLIPLVKQELGL